MHYAIMLVQCCIYLSVILYWQALSQQLVFHQPCNSILPFVRLVNLYLVNEHSIFSKIKFVHLFI